MHKIKKNIAKNEKVMYVYEFFCVIVEEKPELICSKDIVIFFLGQVLFLYFLEYPSITHQNMYLH